MSPIPKGRHRLTGKIARKPEVSGRRTIRAATGVLDQLLYSLTNFVLTILIAHHSSAAGFGRYAILVATFLIASAVNRGLTSEPLVIRFSAARHPDWLEASADGLNLALVYGIAAGGVLCVISWFLAPPGFFGIGSVFGVAMPALFVQDYLRFAALAAGRPAAALMNDLAFGVSQVGLSIFFIATGKGTPVHLLEAWAIAALFGAGAGLRALRIKPRPPHLRRLFTQWDLSSRLGLDNLVTQLTQQSAGYVVGIVSGLAAAGGVRAAQTIFAVPGIVSLSAQAALTPELVRVQAVSLPKLRRMMMLMTVVLTTFSTTFLIAAAVMPEWLGRRLFDGSWGSSKPLLVYVGLAMIAGSGLSVTAIAGLRALADARRTLIARTGAVIVTLPAVVVGAISAQARGACIGLAVSGGLQAAMWWAQFYAALREREARPAAQLTATDVAPAPRRMFI